ncbi:MAG: hypothetical protein RLZZ396_991 [Planctomycetota bacterium]|jgi:hypothetical protein
MLGFLVLSLAVLVLVLVLETPEPIQVDRPFVDRLFKEAGTPVFGPFVNEIPISPFEYEYRFTEYEYEYEKIQWQELLATIMPDGPKTNRLNH